MISYVTRFQKCVYYFKATRYTTINHVIYSCNINKSIHARETEEEKERERENREGEREIKKEKIERERGRDENRGCEEVRERESN